MRSRHKDVKKWYNDNPELQNKCGYFEWFILDMVNSVILARIGRLETLERGGSGVFEIPGF